MSRPSTFFVQFPKHGPDRVHLRYRDVAVAQATLIGRLQVHNYYDTHFGTVRRFKAFVRLLRALNHMREEQS